MKKLLVSAVLFAALVPGLALAKEVTTTLAVTGWHCAGCSAKTEEALKGVPGVKSAKADHVKGTAIVTYDDAKADTAKLEAAVASAGFTVKK